MAGGTLFGCDPAVIDATPADGTTTDGASGTGPTGAPGTTGASSPPPTITDAMTVSAGPTTLSTSAGNGTSGDSESSGSSPTGRATTTGPATETSTSETSTTGHTTGDTTTGSSDSGTTGGEVGGELPPSVAVFVVQDDATLDRALWYMRLDVDDPASTAEFLATDAWRVCENSRSTGRFVCLRRSNPTERRYVDFAQDPPEVHAFPDPAVDFPIVEAALLEDAAGWLVQGRNATEGRSLLFRIPMDDDGELGPAQNLTPQTLPGHGFSPWAWDISSDGSTLAIAGVLGGAMLPYRLFSVDLLDPSESPTDLGTINQQHGSHSPSNVHLTPDGGEVVFAQSFQFGIEQWWIDVDGPAGSVPEFIGPGQSRPWSDDGRRGLWDEWSPQDLHNWLEVGASSVSSTPLPAGRAISVAGGDRVMIATEDSGGTILMGDAFGPYDPLFGGGAGEATVQSALMAGDSHVMVRYDSAGGGYDVEVVEVDGNLILDAVTIAAGTQDASWIYNDEEFAMFRFDEDDRYWRIAFDDLDGFSAWTVPLPGGEAGFRGSSPEGDYLLHVDNGAQATYVVRTAEQATPIDLVDMGPYRYYASLYIAPASRTNR